MQPGCTIEVPPVLACAQIPRAIRVVHPGCTTLRLRRPHGDLSKAFACQRVPTSPVTSLRLLGLCHRQPYSRFVRYRSSSFIIRRDYGTRRATHACQADRRGMRCCKVSRNAVRSRLRPARCKLTSLVHRPRVVFGSRCYYYRSGNNPIPSTPFKGGINQQAHPRVFHTRRKSDRRSGVSYRAAESQ